MTFDPAKPRYTLPFAGKEYDVDGTFALIEAIEYALKDDIFNVANRVIDRLTVSDTAKIIAAILNLSGEKTTATQAGDAIFEMGIDSEEFAMLRLHLFALLRVTLTPPKDREQVAKKMGEMIGKR